MTQNFLWVGGCRRTPFLAYCGHHVVSHSSRIRPFVVPFGFLQLDHLRCFQHVCSLCFRSAWSGLSPDGQVSFWSFGLGVYILYLFPPPVFRVLLQVCERLAGNPFMVLPFAPCHCLANFLATILPWVFSFMERSPLVYCPLLVPSVGVLLYRVRILELVLRSWPWP